MREAQRLTALAIDEPCDECNRIEVFRHELFVLNDDVIRVLEEAHELQDAGRVDDGSLLERILVGEREAAGFLTEEEVIDDEAP